MRDDKVFLTPLQAQALLPDKEEIHVYANPAPSVLLGADWSRQEVIKEIADAEEREVTGPIAQKAGYGLSVLGKYGRWFIQTKP